MMDTEHALGAERVCYVYILRIIAGVGIIGNILSLFVLRRRSLNDSPYTYLTALAVSDLLVLGIMLGIGAVRCGDCDLNENEKSTGFFFEIFIYLPFINIAHNSSTFITVAMTIERFIFVRCPLMAKNLCSRSKAKITIFIVVLTAVCINVPRFFLFRLHQTARIPGDVVWQGPSFVIIECTLPSAGSTNSNSSCILNIPNQAIGKEVPLRMKMPNTFIVNTKDELNKLLAKSPSKVENLKKTCFSYEEEELQDTINVFLYTTDPLNEFPEVQVQFYSLNYNLSQNQIAQDMSGFFLPNFRNSGEVTVAVNVTSIDLLASLVTKYPCLLNNSKVDLPIIPIQPPEVTKSTYYNSMYTIVYATITSFEILSTVILTTLNTCLIKMVQRSNLIRQKLTAKCYNPADTCKQEQNRLTITLIIITSLTTIATFLSAMTNDLVAETMLGQSYKEDNNTYRWLRMANNLFALINHSINFALYALFNTRFRKEFRLALISFISHFRFGTTPERRVHRCLEQSASGSSVNTIFSEHSTNLTFPKSLLNVPIGVMKEEHDVSDVQL